MRELAPVANEFSVRAQNDVRVHQNNQSLIYDRDGLQRLWKLFKQFNALSNIIATGDND